jgi:molybdopterin-guanine dinucleotide biosynthesis protein B
MGFSGWSGSGKTTLIERLIPCFTARGLRVALIKHAHHAFDIDQPGKDSYRHRQAGATEVLVSSANRWALMHELRGGEEPTLAQHLARLSPCDLVLVEGWKFHPIPKLEVWREANGKPLRQPEDPHIVALAYAGQLPDGQLPAGTSPAAPAIASDLPRFALNDVEAIAQWMLDYLQLETRN